MNTTKWCMAARTKFNLLITENYGEVAAFEKVWLPEWVY